LDAKDVAVWFGFRVVGSSGWGIDEVREGWTGVGGEFFEECLRLGLCQGTHFFKQSRVRIEVVILVYKKLKKSFPIWSVAKISRSSPAKMLAPKKFLGLDSKRRLNDNTPD
jgi:hypothetical protein